MLVTLRRAWTDFEPRQNCWWLLRNSATTWGKHNINMFSESTTFHSDYDNTFGFGPPYKHIHPGLEVRGWGLLITSHANRLIEMTTSHCCRVLCSHPSFFWANSTHPSSLEYFAIVGDRIKNATFMPWFVAFLTLRGKNQDPLGFSPVLILYLPRSCVGVQTNCHFIDYRTFQVCFCCC